MRRSAPPQPAYFGMIVEAGGQPHIATRYQPGERYGPDSAAALCDADGPRYRPAMTSGARPPWICARCWQRWARAQGIDVRDAWNERSPDDHPA